MRLDRRTIHALALVAWAGVFAWLWLTGESVRYLGPRTQWVVPVGAIGLAFAAGGYLYATRDDPPGRISLREGLGLTGLVFPIVAAAILANAQLGALAASNKLSSRGIDSAALARLASRDAKQIGFLQLNAAGRDESLTRELGLGPGKPVELLGFVSKTGKPFTLSRFYISCCVADAVPIGVRVLSRRGAPPSRNDWLDVTGVLTRGHREWIISATRIEHVKAPSDPYLNWAS
jgi:uncharacterized repeat protein (TIGR03943 family)